MSRRQEEEMTEVERQEGRGYPPPKRAELSPFDRRLFARFESDVPLAGEPDPEADVIIWRYSAGEYGRTGTAAPYYSVRVLDEHAGDAPSLGEAVRIAALACFESTGEDASVAAVGWWLGDRRGDGGPVTPLDHASPGTQEAFALAWAQYQQGEVKLTLGVTLTRGQIEDVRRLLADAIQDRHGRGAAEVLLCGLGEAVDEAESGARS